MKVTVCFDKVRVVVPCGNGQLLVSDLMEEATARFRKALGKAPNHWITVRTLKSSDGGILDPDDHVADVADDRDQIFAEFYEGVCPRLQSGADGTSASSAGTSSPDPFTASKEFTSWNNLGKDNDSSNNLQGVSATQPVTSQRKPILDKKVCYASHQTWLEDASKETVFDPFARLASARKSVMFSTMQWIESQEGLDPESIKDKLGAVDIANSAAPEDRNEEPKNCEVLPNVDFDLEHSTCRPTKFVPITSTRMLGKRIEMNLMKDSDGLGFSITTRDNFSAGDAPIYIKTILPRGAAIRDGRLHPGDRLLEVNGIAMSGKSQEEATSILRSLDVGCTVELVVSRQMIDIDHPAQTDDQETDEFCGLAEQTPAVCKDRGEDMKAVVGGLMKATTVPEKDPIVDIGRRGEGQVKKDVYTADGSQTEEKTSGNEEPRQGDTAVVTDKGQACIINRGQVLVTDRGQTPVTDRGHMEEDSPSKDMEPERLVITIARTEHQGSGLGVSVKGKTLETAVETKDLGLFIWSILPGGAAAKDGRLRPDDRLTGINGKSLIGRTNNDAMEILRGALQYNKCHSIELNILRNRLTPDMILRDRRFRVPLSSFASCTQPCSEIVSNFSDANSTRENVFYHTVVCSEADNNVSRLIERKEAIPVESFVSLPSVADNPVSELKSSRNSVAADMSDCDDGRVVSGAKEAATYSEQKASVETRHVDSYLSGSSRTIKSSENGSTVELDSELGPLGVFSRDGFGRQSVSEKRKACVDPRSFALYHQIKSGKKENVHNPVKRALSVESILKQKMMPSTISPISMVVSDENLKRFNSFESMQTVNQSCLRKTKESSSQSRSQQDLKQISFRDAFGYCYESQLITGENIDSDSSRLGQSVLAGERKKKKKVLRGLSSVFRFGKVKKNTIDSNVSYCQTEREARKLSDKRQKLQSYVIPNSSINERLLQMAKFPSRSSNDASSDQEHSENDSRREHCYALDRSAQPDSSLFDRSTGTCQCETNSRQVLCPIAGINVHEQMDDSTLRQFQTGGWCSNPGSDQNPPQAQHLPNRQREQCSNCSESTSGRTHPMFITANKMRFREVQGRERRHNKAGGNLTSHNAPDPGSRRFPCCRAVGEEISFPEGYYHKLELESMESVNRWNTPQHLPAENLSVSKCDTSGSAPRTDQNTGKRNIPNDSDSGKRRLTKLPNAAPI